jgi:NAD(P)-dependent dehydrogenase (short-subunit alcohol dehydrogenase family)
MDKRLRNRVALITSTGGAGLAAAKKFATEGAEVIVIAGTGDAKARHELAGVATVIELDAGDEAKVAALFTTLGRKHGRLDILFLNAGSVAAFDEAWSVNVRGLWLALKHATPILSEGAAVIVDTSVVDQSSLEAASAWGATQGALRTIVRIAARDLAGRNVRVNGISLGASARCADEVASAATFLASRDSFITGAELTVGGLA